MPNNTYTYDRDTDYTLLIREAVAAGDLAAAARYEQQRNQKIISEGLGYPTTDQYAAYLPENRYRFDPEGDADYTAAKARMDAAFRALTEGGHFSYDPDADPVYQAYASRYLREGRAAMEDTLGRTASLTGGYGSSYASAAAQQMYEAYLGRLHDVLPELYAAAWKRHRERQSDRAAAYNYARADADRAYDRAYDRWEKQLKLSREDEAYTAGRYAAADKAAADAASGADKARQSRRSDLGEMIFKTGYTPTDAELAAAGMTRAEAEAWKQAYYRNLK